VATKKPNQLGLYDMSGNVWEWVSTIYDQERFPYPYVSDDGREDTSDLSSYRGVRGGSWGKDGNSLSATYRERARPDFEGNGIGFRCARDSS
jgi:formylglycine-generating enzyme required for sulfatase activity